MRRKTARERIERAFYVSFILPEQAAKLLDEYRDEVIAQERKEMSCKVRSIRYPPDAGKNWHWFVFAINRAADFIEGRYHG